MSNQRKTSGKRPKKRELDPQVRREEILRPSIYLGYDRDDIGLHLLGREAFELAAQQFGRAVWLNPYEPMFKVHWAIALLKLNQKQQAHDLLREVLTGDKPVKLAEEMWRVYWPDEPQPAPVRAGQGAQACGQ